MAARFFRVGEDKKMKNTLYEAAKESVILSLNTLLKTETFHLYRILYSQKYFGNMMVDIKSDLLGVRFFSDRDEGDACVYLLEDFFCVYSLTDVLLIIGAKPETFRSKFPVYLEQCAEIIKNSYQKIQEIFTSHEKFSELQRKLFVRTEDGDWFFKSDKFYDIKESFCN